MQRLTRRTGDASTTMDKASAIVAAVGTAADELGVAADAAAGTPFALVGAAARTDTALQVLELVVGWHFGDDGACALYR